MPIYEFRCECKEEREVLLPSPTPQVCSCGRVMELRMSVSNFVMRPTGRGMALDTLNSKNGGLPEGRNKAFAEQMAARGL